MKKIKYISIIIIFSLLNSCRKELEIKPSDFQDKPVVSCLFTSDDYLRLQLGKTKTIGSNEEEIITQANCYLLVNNIVIDTLKHLQNGEYVSKLKPTISINYQLRIETNNSENLEAGSYVPAKPAIISVEQEDFSVVNNTFEIGGDMKLPLNKLSITFKDIADEKNYYELKVLLKQFWDDSLSSHSVFKMALYSQDISIKNEEILDYRPFSLVFSDTLFDGQNKTIDFLYKPNWTLKFGQSEYTYGKYRLYYYFRTISKEMYQYKKTLIKHVYNQQTSDFAVLGDPVKTFTNIKNGYGIFAGYNEILDSVFVEGTFFSF